MSEVEHAVKKLKNNKGVGIDGIPGELLKNGGQELTKKMYEICNWIWTNEDIPRTWTKSVIITIPKKGDIQDCSNYRTISLISHSSKILLLIILNRLRAQLHCHLSEEQAGFRANRNTIQQILTLRLVAEKFRDVNQPVYNCFIDFWKAFDSVWHDGLWVLYEKAESAVLVDGSLSRWIKMTDGNRQGDPISPNAFIGLVERIMDGVSEMEDKGVV